MLIDLHTHSVKSDGALLPREVVDTAKEAGLAAISLTDHDVIDGVEEAMARGAEVGVEVIPGIELSAKFKTETHVLGYFVDLKNPGFLEKLEEIKRVRMQRNYETAENLQKIGFPVTVEDAMELAPNGIIGRAHFARVMANRGYVASVKEAFDKYLANGKPGYSTLQLLTPRDAVELIKSAGGLAFLAHLHLTRLEGQELYDFVADLKDAGMDGIEGYYTEYTPEMETEYQGLAEKLDLAISGGTDFHGAMKPHISIGKGLGNMSIPYSVLENIKQLRK